MLKWQQKIDNLYFSEFNFPDNPQTVGIDPKVLPVLAPFPSCGHLHGHPLPGFYSFLHHII